MKYCTQCGHPNANDAKFCAACGHQLITTRSNTADTPEISNMRTKTQSHATHHWLLLTGIISALISLLAVPALFGLIAIMIGIVLIAKYKYRTGYLLIVGSVITITFGSLAGYFMTGWWLS